MMALCAVVMLTWCRYGIFQLQKKMRHTKITRMWYRK